MEGKFEPKNTVLEKTASKKRKQRQQGSTETKKVRREASEEFIAKEDGISQEKKNFYP